MEVYEIINEEWEEHIVYYYSRKMVIKKFDFLEIVAEKEKFSTNIFDVDCQLTIELDDFQKFTNERIGNDKVESSFVIESEWNSEITFIETENFYIIRIWTTSA